MPTRAADTYVSAGDFRAGDFSSNDFAVSEVRLQGHGVEFAGLAQCVFDMWDRLFASEGW
jgi:hypothetical protein